MSPAQEGFALLGKENVGEVRRNVGSAVVVPGVPNRLLVGERAGVRVRA